MAKTVLDYAAELAGNDYTVSLEDGRVVARFKAPSWLSADADDPSPERRAQFLNWSVRTAMGESPEMPPWMIEAGYQAPADANQPGSE